MTDSREEQARRAALDSSLSLKEKLRLINQLADQEDTATGEGTSVRCYAEMATMIAEAERAS
jgi:hypothetical protein